MGWPPRNEWRSCHAFPAWRSNYAPYKYDLANFNTMVHPQLETTVVGSFVTVVIKWTGPKGGPVEEAEASYKCEW